MGSPGDSVVKNPSANAGDLGSIPEVGRSTGEGNATQSTSLFLPGKSQGQRNLGYMGFPQRNLVGYMGSHDLATKQQRICYRN